MRAVVVKLHILSENVRNALSPATPPAKARPPLGSPRDLTKRIQKSIKFRDRLLIDFYRFWSSKWIPKSIKNHEKITFESLSCSDSVFSCFLHQKREACTLINIGVPLIKHRCFMCSPFRFWSRFWSSKVMKTSSKIH